MAAYLIRRLFAIVVLVFSISVLVFLIIHLIPGDPAAELLGTNAGNKEMIARLNQQLGLDRPIHVQYLIWIGNVLKGNFGYSFGYQMPVINLIVANFPATVQLTFAALTLSLFFGLVIGTVAALNRNSPADTIGMGIVLTFMSIPSFWLGLLLILAFAVQLHWFNVVGGTSLKGLVLPAVTLALGTIGFNARFVRSSLIAAKSQHHVITARAKGITRMQVFLRHILRNALLPILTVVGLQMGQLLSGTVVVETVFSRPGIGRLLVQAILGKDYLTVQAVVLIIAVIYALTNLIVDLLYPVLDPRIARR
ncbi:ABC transporter permease [Rhizobium binxianense]